MRSRSDAEAGRRADAADRGAAGRGAAAALGQPDLLDIAPIGRGAARRSSPTSGLLFAIGIAVGSRARTTAPRASRARCAIFVATKGAEVLISVPPRSCGSRRGDGPGRAAYKRAASRKLSVPSGIISGSSRRALQPLQQTSSCRATSRSSAAALRADRRGRRGLALAFVFGWLAAARARHGRSRAA
jgi:hypothetical protein